MSFFFCIYISGIRGLTGLANRRGMGARKLILSACYEAIEWNITVTRCIVRTVLRPEFCNSDFNCHILQMQRTAGLGKRCDNVFTFIVPVGQIEYRMHVLTVSTFGEIVNPELS